MKLIQLNLSVWKYYIFLVASDKWANYILLASVYIIFPTKSSKQDFVVSFIFSIIASSYKHYKFLNKISNNAKIVAFKPHVIS